MANLSDEELTIVALILDKETEYTKKKKKNGFTKLGHLPSSIYFELDK